MKNFFKLIIGLFMILSSFFASAQNRLAEDIQSHKNQGRIFEFQENILSTDLTVGKNLDSHFHDPKQVSFLRYNNKILESNDELISLEIPFNNSIIVVDLMNVTTSFLNYKVVSSDGSIQNSSTENRFYRGVIRGKNKSIVALSFYNDDVIGVISSDEGNINISRLKDTDTFIIFKENNLRHIKPFECKVDDEDSESFTGYDPDILLGNGIESDRSVSSCVEFYFETEYDMFQTLGSITAVENYVTGLYNVVGTIYLNEGITTTISEIKVWDIVNDPYSTTDIYQLLPQFQGQNPTFNGHFGQLLTFKHNDGRAPHGAPCGSSNNRLSVAGIEDPYLDFLTYTKSVTVSTHEFGHLFGSRHTHWCVWVGPGPSFLPNQPIDSCASDNNSACINPYVYALPPNGGTIMSYCDYYDFNLSQYVGYPLSNGFGLQPGNYIRNVVDTSSCLVDCCPGILFITDIITNSDIDHEEALIRIKANNIIEQNSEAVYHAGQEVLMIDGFEVTTNAEYRAYIEGCTGNFVKSVGSVTTSETANQPFSEDISLTDPDDPLLEKQLMIRPNPANNMITINMSDHSILENFNLKILGINGALMYQNQFQNQHVEQIQIDVSRFESGVYFIELINNFNESVYSGKIIKVD